MTPEKAPITGKATALVAPAAAVRPPVLTLDGTLSEMHTVYLANPTKAVRGQGFIKVLHRYLANALEERIAGEGKKRKIFIKLEAHIFGSHKPKNVDVAVIDPENGPLIMVGVRSQMSSIGNNALTYYQDIIGECISIQDRFPMAVIGYVYLMPLAESLGKKSSIDHARYTKMYAAISGRSGQDYKSIRGVYDQFAYLVVDFRQNPPVLQDGLVAAAVPNTDLSLATFIDRMVETFKERHLFLDFFL